MCVIGWERYHEWPLLQNMIIGPSKSGKTTLMTLAKKKYSVLCLSPGEQLFMPPVSALPSSAIFLDDAEKVPQEWLFHLINHQFLKGHKLTLLTTKSSHEWVCETKDLESRLKSFYPLEIQSHG